MEVNFIENYSGMMFAASKSWNTRGERNVGGERAEKQKECEG